MNKEHKPYNIEYTFYIQSAENFYNQLRQFHKEDVEQEQQIDVDTLELAQTMLRGIGVNV